MNVVSSGVTKVDQHGTQKIELIGRNCYKSLDKIKEGSDIEFCKNLIASGHTAPFEHEYVYFKNYGLPRDLIKDLLLCNRYIYYDSHSKLLVFNYRVFIDTAYSVTRNGMLVDIIDSGFEILTIIYALYMQCSELHPIFGTILQGEQELLINSDKAKEYSKILVRVYENNVHTMNPAMEAITLMFRTDRGITHELVRHKELSFMQESTRYCNYTKDRFENSINVVEPIDWDYNYVDEDRMEWNDAMVEAEAHYTSLIKDHGFTPQNARSVLPTATKADIFVTGLMFQWKGYIQEAHLAESVIKENKGFIPLRYNKAAHPMMKRVAAEAYSILKAHSPEYFKDYIPSI